MIGWLGHMILKNIFNQKCPYLIYYYFYKNLDNTHVEYLNFILSKIRNNLNENLQ